MGRKHFWVSGRTKDGNTIYANSFVGVSEYDAACEFLKAMYCIGNEIDTIKSTFEYEE